MQNPRRIPGTTMWRMAGDVRLCVHVYVTVLIGTLTFTGSVDAQGVQDVFSAIGGLMGELGAGEDCEFECPNGARPQPNTNHVPSSNGCGSYGLMLESQDLPGMTKCCDVHDKCYDTCGSDRGICDAEFKRCLKRMCRVLKEKSGYTQKQFDGCKSAADLMFVGTTALGCNAFIESQKKACSCGAQKGRKRPDNEL